MTRIRAILGVLAALPATSCATTGRADGMLTGTLEHDNLTRRYHVYVPAGHSKNDPVPLVIALHGGGGRGEKFDESTRGQMTRAAEKRGWIVVYPEGVKRGWNDGRKIETRRDAQRAHVDDVGFISTLIERMRSDHGIDRDRVYATGISNGGFMAMRLATDLSEKIVAIAAVTATLGRVLEDRKPAHPVGILIMNGTEDPLVPYEGGHVTLFGRRRGEILSTDDTIDWWVAANGCTGDRVERELLPDVDESDGTTVVVSTRTGCRGNRSVVSYQIRGGGHTWPGGVQYLPRKLIGVVSREIDAAEEIFDFFSTQKRSEVRGSGFE